MKKALIAILGPTAAGKTDVAISLAQFLQTEIISADARQFYKELNVGVARPDEKQLAVVPHHFIAFRSVHDEYTAGEFEKEALKKIDTLFRKHDVVILVGGAGFYAHAVMEGLDAVPPADEKIRAALNDELEKNGLEALQQRLRELDPQYFEAADIQNPHRVLRALEVCLATGKPFSSFHKKKKKQRDFRILKIGITLPRHILYEKINDRVDAMIKNGLEEEARKLFPLKHLPALNTVGYKEFFSFFAGEISFDKAVELIKQNSRNYAKRQLTWFRKDTEINWFESQPLNEILKFLKTQE